MLMAEDILQNESSKDRRSHNVQREILGRAGKHTIIHIFAEYTMSRRPTENNFAGDIKENAKIEKYICFSCKRLPTINIKFDYWSDSLFIYSASNI